MKSFKRYFAPGAVNNAARLEPAKGATSGENSLNRQLDAVFPPVDVPDSGNASVNEIRCDVIVNWLHSQQEENLWFTGEQNQGAILKQSKDNYACSPADLSREPGGFLDSMKILNVRVAMTVTTSVIQVLLSAGDASAIEVEPGLCIQVLPKMSDLAQCQKNQFAAFIAGSGTLVVWEDNPKRLVPRIKNLETLLVQTVWKNQSAYPLVEEIKGPLDANDSSEPYDPENPNVAKRQVVLIQSLLTAATLTLMLATFGSGWGLIAFEVCTDGGFARLGLLAAVVPQCWLSLFFFQVIISDVAQLIGPINQLKSNTKYFSGIRPRRLIRGRNPLPHVTIQCPVYKEGLHSVISPTVRSLKEAISTYEMQGGTANIFVNDDGMQLIPEADASARQEFYEENGIGWVSRPKHGQVRPDGGEPFLRRGKFKKASNMNYAMWISTQVEERLEAVQREEPWTEEDEHKAYGTALSGVVAAENGRAWAAGNIRIGDYILLVDSDTRVPTDCLLDAVSELEQSPEVAILQYSSGVMNVTDSFFEMGITFFTNLVYTQIQYAVANGDVAPFVGHNAFLRWSALQGAAYDCELDHREKYWSETTVSEDFDMALRLQTDGYLVRLGAYTGDGFKEGVSLTVYDELNRWEKYAYGCNELVFHPLYYWPTRGPLTSLFRKFISSNMPLPSKFTIMAYVGTYYALGSAWILTIANYFLAGWNYGHLDKYYVDSFQIHFGIIAVFSCLGNVALGVLRFRAYHKELVPSILEAFKWIPLLMIFLGGVSIHVSQALLSHMFGIEVTWGATAKEITKIKFFQELPKVMRNFKLTFAFCVVVAAGMVATTYFVPPLWQIRQFFAIWPLATLIFCHFALPIVLNPNLMRWKW